jgi:hypothetical protein
MSTKLPECWSIAPLARQLRVEISPRQSVILPFEHFAYSELVPDGDTEILKIVFTSYQVVLHGTSLRRIENAVHQRELSFVMVVPDRFRQLMAGQPCIERIELIPVNEETELPGFDSQSKQVGQGQSLEAS